MNSGIYIIINDVDNKFYLGSSKNLNKRMNTHFLNLKKNKHHSLYLQNAYNKYGKEKFRFIIIEYVEEDNLTDVENFYLQLYKPEYNIAKDAKSPMKNRKHKAETIEKFKSREFPKGKDCHLYGKKWSKDLRKKILKARKGYKHSEETKTKMKNTANRINAISRIDREKSKKPIVDSLGNNFNSLAEAAKYHNISVATVCDILKGRHSKTRKGVSFNYA